MDPEIGKMNTPRVTIGIPCFNAERWLGESIESALQQTWPNKDVIVVDNGSTDRSPEIIRQFGNRIRPFLITQRGANRARNEVLRQSTGEWIQYLDADDYLLPAKITRQLEEAEDQRSDVGGQRSGKADFLAPLTSDLRPLTSGLLYSPVLIEEHGTTRSGELDQNLDLASQWISWQLPQTGAFLWRKDTLEHLGGWDESMPCCQEHELYLRAIQAGARFQFTPTANAVYRIWSDETLCRKDPLLVIETRTGLIDQMLLWLDQEGRLSDSHRATAGRAFFEMARTMAKHDLQKAAAYLKQKQSRGLVKLNSPAAPPAYRALFHLFGFKSAERIAGFLRAR